MGTIFHEVIFVTAPGYDDWVARARGVAVSLGLRVTEIVCHEANGDSSFVIVPDGSKEGWDTHMTADEKRAEWMRAMQRPPFWHRVSFLHVTHNHDHGHATVTDEYHAPIDLYTRHQRIENEILRLATLSADIKRRIDRGET